MLVDSNGNSYRYRKLVWAADLKTLYRVTNLAALTDTEVVRKIQARQEEISTKTGSDSVFTLYLTTNLDKSYFAKISNPHFFYTPSTSGLSSAASMSCSILTRMATRNLLLISSGLSTWLKRFLELNTFEISCPVLRDDVLPLLEKQA